MSIDFPTNPNERDAYTDPVTKQSFTYNGAAWVRHNIGKGIPDAPVDGIQYAREDAAWRKLSPEELFLGHFEIAPTLDNYGKPLVPGHLYYNELIGKQYTWDGVVWVAFSATLSFSNAKHYVWRLAAPVQINDPVSGPDDYGNTPSGWKSATLQNIVVYRNGKRLINELDVSLVTGDYAIDYARSEIVVKNTAFQTNDEIVVQIVAIVTEEPALHPYVNNIYKDVDENQQNPGQITNPGDGTFFAGFSSATFVREGEIADFIIIGGNFDQNTNVTGTNGLLLRGTVVESDNRIRVTVEGTADPVTHEITVFNTDREQFGNSISIESTGSSMVLVYEVGEPRTLILPIDTTSGKQDNLLITILWGDGLTTTYDSSYYADGFNIGHIYATPGTYTVEIGGVCEYFTNVASHQPGNPSLEPARLISVEQLGDLNTLDYSDTFANQIHLKSFSVKGGDLSEITSLNSLLRGCDELETVDFTGADTSKVTDTGKMVYKCGKLTTALLDDLDTSNVTNFESMFYRCTLLSTLDLSGFVTGNVQSFRYMFQGCSELKFINVSTWDMSSATVLGGMFRDCQKLETLDVSNWDTSQVDIMDWMFYQTFSLNALDVSNWDVSNLVSATYAFYHIFLYSTTDITLDVSTWNTVNLREMRGMFAGNQTHMIDLDASGWDISNLITADKAFSHKSYSIEMYDKLLIAWAAQVEITSYISNIHLGAEYTFYTAKAAHDILREDYGWMLKDLGYRNIDGISIGINVSGGSGTFAPIVNLPLVSTGVYNFTVDWGDGSPIDTITSWNQPETQHTYPENAAAIHYRVELTGQVSQVEFANMTGVIGFSEVQFGDTGLTTLENAFLNAETVPAIKFHKQSLHLVTSMEGAFENCGSLQMLEFDEDASMYSVTNFDRTFKNVGYQGGSTNPLTLFINGFFNMSAAISADNMFESSHIDGKSFRDGKSFTTTVLESTVGMFMHTDMYALFPFELFDTSTVTNMSRMFSDTSMSINKWHLINTSNVEFMYRMFDGCRVNIPLLNGFDTANVTDMSYMFIDAKIDYTKLTEFLSTFNTAKVTTFESFMESFDSVTQSSSQLVTLDLQYFDTSSCTTMKRMFAATITAKNLYIDTILMGTWDTSNVTDMSEMFVGQPHMEYLDFGNWLTPALQTIKNMCLNMYELTSVNAPNLVQSATTHMDLAFAYNGKLETVSMVGWDTSGITNMYNVFYDASVLRDIDPASWDISNVTLIGGAFNRMYEWDSVYYTALLNAWSTQTVQPGVSLDLIQMKYDAVAQPARDILTGTPNNWSINDGGVIT